MVTIDNIANSRLENQYLLSPQFLSPQEVVAWLGAVQAQDYLAAKWSLGRRLRHATDKDMEKVFNEGSILRTHIMRPTWHFVAPEDIRWMLGLTSARVHAVNTSMYRKLELEEKLLFRCHTVLSNALIGGRQLTRAELAESLKERGIMAIGQRLAYIIMHAELDALICSGPRREKQFTYALLAERAPKGKTLDRDESLAELALRYFRSHGPALLKDFAWWSGLTLKEANEGVHLAKSQLVEETVDGKTYWFSPHMQVRKPKSPTAFFLSIYDEYTIAYKDRSPISDEKYVEKLLSMGNALNSVIILDGRIAGTWKRVFKRGGIEVTINPLRPLSQSEREEIEAEAVRYGKFLEMPLIFSLSVP
jgi:hypothetical protein